MKAEGKSKRIKGGNTPVSPHTCQEPIRQRHCVFCFTHVIVFPGILKSICLPRVHVQRGGCRDALRWGSLYVSAVWILE